MLAQDDKDEIFSKLLGHLMTEMGGQDASDKFSPEPKPEDIESIVPGENPLGHDMSPFEGQMDDGETPHDPAQKGMMVEEIDLIPEEGGEEDEDKDESPFSSDYFKSRK